MAFTIASCGNHAFMLCTAVSFPREVIEEGRAVTGTFADDGDDDDAENTSTEQTKGV